MALDDYAGLPDRGLGLAEVIASLGRRGPAVPTGVPFLDKLFDKGGIYPGKLLVLVGPPGSFKTTLGCMLLNAMSPRFRARALFVDEGREEAAIRLGQQLGYKRDDLEAGGPGLIKFIKQRMEDTFILDDPDEKEASILNTLDLLSRDGPSDVPKLCILDSIQRVKLRPEQKAAPNEREAIDEAVYTFRDHIRERRMFGVLISKANRERYASTKDSERSHALAASQGSSAPEYAGDFVLSFGTANEDDVVRCEVAKNRMGRLAVVHVRLDRERATLLEIDSAAVEEQEAKEASAAELKRAERLAPRVLEEVRRSPGISSNQVVAEVGGHRSDILRALRHLEGTGQIVCSTGKRRQRTYAAAEP